MHLLGFALAFFIGVTLGLMGGGGSILTVPVLVYLFQYEAKQAIAISLAVVGLAALVGALNHWKLGHVKMKVALLFGGFAMSGSFVSAKWISPWFSGTLQLLVFSLTMIFAAVFMYRGRKEPENDPSDTKIRKLTLALQGLLVGAFTGLVGIGGGFLIVPALVLFARLPMKHAIGTSLAIMVLNSTAGFSGYLGHVPLPWKFILVFTALAAAGILAGSRLVGYLSPTSLKKAFAIFLMIMGIILVYKNAEKLSGIKKRQASTKVQLKHAV